MEKLHIKDGRVYKGNSLFVLKGISSHGLNWYPEYINIETLKWFKQNWKINAVRLAMYTKEGGYLDADVKGREEYERIIDRGIKAAVDLDLYVIIDWHILSDYNPKMHVKEAEAFFMKMSAAYAGIPNVIYEICNEPNKETTWEDITSYAEQIIPLIRKNSDGLILVGTPCWSQEVDKPALKPLRYENLAYSLHFYSSTHGQDLMNKIDFALDKKLPVFVSEFGISPASGNGPIDYKKTAEWLSFINQRGLSHFAWALGNRDETCCFIKPEVSKLTGFLKEDFTPCGQYLMDYYSK